MTRLKMAVIGGGHLGRIHAKLLKTQDAVELVAVADPDPAAREIVSAELGVRAIADYASIVPEVQAAVLATPSITHHDIGVELLSRGIDLLVEKPLAVSLAEAESLARAAARHGRVVQVGHVERFNPAIRAAWPVIQDPQYIETRRVCQHSFRSLDIGVVLDLMVHDLDLVLATVDSEVTAVQAIGAAVFGGKEDMAQARLEFANGCVANLTASRVSLHTQRTAGFYCPTCYVGVDMNQAQVDVVRGGPALAGDSLCLDSLNAATRTQLREQLFQTVLHHETLDIPDGNALLDEQRDFVAAVTESRAPQITVDDGVLRLAVADRILAAIDSHAGQGRRADKAETLKIGEQAPFRFPTSPAPHPVDPTRRKAG